MTFGVGEGREDAVARAGAGNQEAGEMRRVVKSGFTLIELMMVLAIIGILSSLVFAGINLTRRKAAKARCRTEVRDLAKAWKAYWMAYQSWPSGFAGSARDMDKTAMAYLQGDNPQKLKFLDVGAEAVERGGYYDPFGTLYRVDFSRTITAGQFEYYETTVFFPNRKRFWDRVQAEAGP